jgi:hypothetical protein
VERLVAACDALRALFEVRDGRLDFRPDVSPTERSETENFVRDHFHPAVDRADRGSPVQNSIAELVQFIMTEVRPATLTPVDPAMSDRAVCGTCHDLISWLKIATGVGRPWQPELPWDHRRMESVRALIAMRLDLAATLELTPDGVWFQPHVPPRQREEIGAYLHEHYRPVTDAD